MAGRPARALGPRADSPMVTSPSTAPSHPSPPSHVGDDDVIRVLRDDGSLDPAHDPKLDDELVVALYRHMVRPACSTSGS